MDTKPLADAIMTSLQFKATLMTLMLGFNGFAVGRLWPEKRAAPLGTLFWLVPGLAVTAWALYRVIGEYHEVALSLSRDTVLEYYTRWLDTYWVDYWQLALAMFLSLAGFGIALKQGEKPDGQQGSRHLSE